MCSDRAKFYARMQFFSRLLLTPDFWRAKFAVMDTSRFKGLRCYGKPLKRLACVKSGTGLNSGVNHDEYEANRLCL